MKRIYVDSSAIAAILLIEEKASQYQKFLDHAEEVVSSSLLEAEIYSVAARERVDSHLLEKTLSHISISIPERTLRREYSLIFSHGYCRGADAHHIATAMYLDPTCRVLTFLTADRSQKEMARKVGFKTV